MLRRSRQNSKRQAHFMQPELEGHVCCTRNSWRGAAARENRRHRKWVLVSSLPFCLYFPPNEPARAAPCLPRGLRTTRRPCVHVACAAARRRGPPTPDGGCPGGARLPRFGFGNYSPSPFCLCAAPFPLPPSVPPLLKALSFASTLRCGKDSCPRVLIGKDSCPRVIICQECPRFGHGCSVRRRV